MYLTAEEAWTAAAPLLEKYGDMPAYGKRLRFMARIIRKHVQLSSPESVQILEIGCGNGCYLSYPLSLMGYSVLGLDPHQPSIELAQRTYGRDNCEFRCCRVEDLPASQKFSCVILSEVIEHLDDPGTMIQLAAARLAPGGILIVTTPNGYGEFEIDNWFWRHLHMERVIAPFRRNRNFGPRSSDCLDGHVQFFTLPRLKRLFAERGLEILESVASVFACGAFASYLMNRLPRSVRTWNERLADHLPMAMSSAWYFALKLKD
jgi:SAM-dependent methyltransferase